ncbi:acyl-CoA dehydrogenase family protein, partial [Bacillus cereus]|nr:acyl-CoA dehydrogenase family protein [Bacillus cereus]
GKKRQDRHTDAVIETTIAKYFASKMAMKVATDAVQVFGGNGFSREYPVERLFREAKVLEIIEGTSQVLQPIIAQHALHTCSQKGGLLRI